MYFRIIALLSLMLVVACAHSTGPERYPSVAPYSAIPAQPSRALTGSEFIERASRLDQNAREKYILKVLRRGHMPNFLRYLQPVRIDGTDRRGRQVSITLWVTPDYLSVGTNDDYLRVPMNPITAQRLADHFGFILPTRKIVNEIYSQADTKLAPATIPPSSRMTTMPAFIDHHGKVQAQLGQSYGAGLIAGHKKDVVITNKLNTRPRQVAIYGWHRTSGKAIQPLSLVHGNHYADYSHGIRLIANMALVNGVEVPTAEILQDPYLSPLLSDEGPLQHIRQQTEIGSRHFSDVSDDLVPGVESEKPTRWVYRWRFDKSQTITTH